MVEIEPDNALAFELFVLCATQWRIGMAGRTGLDYTALQSVMQMQGVEDTKDALWRVRTIEMAALQTWAKSDGKK